MRGGERELMPRLRRRGKEKRTKVSSARERKKN